MKIEKSKRSEGGALRSFPAGHQQYHRAMLSIRWPGRSPTVRADFSLGVGFLNQE